MRNRRSWTWSGAEKYLADKINTASEIVTKERRKSRGKNLIILGLLIIIALLSRTKEE